MKKLLISFLSALTVSAALPLAASAHVAVKPAQVAPGAFQTFITGVPNEKDQPTIGVRVVIPEGLNYVTPSVKQGWQINVTKSGEGETAKVTEIDWTGGSIPAGFRDEFAFSAQAPANQTTLKWKAYQTYQDGTVVSWDQEPSDNHDDEDVTQYSTTEVAETQTDTTPTTNNQRANAALALSVVALVFAIALPFVRKK